MLVSRSFSHAKRILRIVARNMNSLVIETREGIFQLKPGAKDAKPVVLNDGVYTVLSSDNRECMQNVLQMDRLANSTDSSYKGFFVKNSQYLQNCIIAPRDTNIDGDFIRRKLTICEGRIYFDDSKSNDEHSTDRNDVQNEYFAEQYKGHHPIFDNEMQRPVYSSFEKTVIILKKVCSINNSERVLDFVGEALHSSEQHVAKNPFIVVEGLDGTGKSTMVTNLSNNLNAHRRATPPSQISALRKRFDELPELYRRSFYAFSNYLAASDILRSLQTGPVVLDRYWHSTTAYAIAKDTCTDTHLPPPGHTVYEWPADLLRPSAVVFLVTSEHLRDARVNERSETTSEENQLTRDQMLRRRVREIYRRIGSERWVEVDTSGTQQQSLNKALHGLKQLNVI